MASFGVKVGGMVSVVVVLAALLYRQDTHEELKEHMDHVLTALLRAEKKVLPPQSRVAVGFGSCLDIIADGLDVFEKLGANPPDDPEHFNEVDNKEELEKLFAYFYRHGAAAE